jgi:hypothetical protein
LHTGRAYARRIKRSLLVALALPALCLPAAADAKTRLPGVVSPSGNINCFYVPVAHLLCDIKTASYLTQLQDRCQATAGLDWHGFTLTATRRATYNCSGGILYNSNTDVPAPHTLAYGKAWRFGAFTCISRITGLTCTSRYGHGIFLSRQSWRGW